MTLPRLLLLTDRTQAGRPVVEVVGAAVEAGARAVILREKDLPRKQRARLAEQLRSMLAPVGGLLLVASDPSIRADGIHLAAGDPVPDDSRIVGRSCHSHTDLAAAAEAGINYATLSPIHATRSKPGHGPALGPDALADTALPTFALGGVTPTNAAACIRAGAHGVAVMGAVMRAVDPGRVTRQLLDALAGAAGR